MVKCNENLLFVFYYHETCAVLTLKSPYFVFYRFSIVYWVTMKSFFNKNNPFKSKMTLYLLSLKLFVYPLIFGRIIHNGLVFQYL